ncbi:MAG: hypothetical protein K8M05_18130 [Deltaproteobacteria bacterium]|nr:hypothetical protein [Kofleriaceae bacterium]
MRDASRPGVPRAGRPLRRSAQGEIEIVERKRSVRSVRLEPGENGRSRAPGRAMLALAERRRGRPGVGWRSATATSPSPSPADRRATHLSGFRTRASHTHENREHVARKFLTAVRGTQGTQSRVVDRSRAGARGSALVEREGASGRFASPEASSWRYGHSARPKKCVIERTMRAFKLDHVSDDTLLTGLAALATTDRETTAALLAHLGEVDERKLYLPAACSSMHGYCVSVLHFAEDVAFKRIRAARVARRFPAIFDAIADGRMHVTGVVMLAPHFRDDNVEELLATATHASKAEIEELVARLSPRPDLPAQITRMPGNGQANETLELDPDPATGKVDPDPVPDRVRARSPERYGLQVTIGEATRDKLLRAQALLRHRSPSGDLEEVLDRALDALLADLEKEKFGKTSRPRAAKARSADADPRYVPNEVRRVVSERDGEQCAFVSDEGVRCTERGFLELDHRTLVCRGGQPTADGLRWLCGPHNQYEAERVLGKDFMREKREQARARRGSAEEPACVDSALPAGAEGTAREADVGHPPAAIEAHTPELAAVEVDREVTLAMRGMGFGAGETSRAMADSAADGATTFEARLRAALAAWRTARGSRCSEGPFDEAARQLAVRLGCTSKAAFALC